MEVIEKKVIKVDKVKKDVKEILEMLQKSPENMKFMEKEMIVDAMFVRETRGLKMKEILVYLC